MGKLKLDSKVGDFFPNANPPEKRAITVQQLLSMTSGAKNDNSLLGRSDLFSYVLNELPMVAEPGDEVGIQQLGLVAVVARGPRGHRAEHRPVA